MTFESNPNFWGLLSFEIEGLERNPWMKAIHEQKLPYIHTSKKKISLIRVRKRTKSA